MDAWRWMACEWMDERELQVAGDGDYLTRAGAAAQQRVSKKCLGWRISRRPVLTVSSTCWIQARVVWKGQALAPAWLVIFLVFDSVILQ